MTIKEMENLPDSFSELESLWREVSKAYKAAIQKTDIESEALPDFASSGYPKAWRCPSHSELPDLKSQHKIQLVDHQDICKHIASNSTHWDKREPLRQRLQWWMEEKARIDEARKSFDAAEQEQDRIAHYLGRIEKKMLLTEVSSPREMLLKIEIVDDIPTEPTDYSDFHEIVLIGLARDIKHMASAVENTGIKKAA